MPQPLTNSAPRCALANYYLPSSGGSPCGALAALAPSACELPFSVPSPAHPPTTKHHLYASTSAAIGAGFTARAPRGT
jgi:hypothetical protein